MKDVSESQPQSVQVPLVVPEPKAEPLDGKNFDPKFLEAVEIAMKENDELLKRLAS